MFGLRCSPVAMRHLLSTIVPTVRRLLFQLTIHLLGRRCGLVRGRAAGTMTPTSRWRFGLPPPCSGLGISGLMFLRPKFRCQPLKERGQHLYNFTGGAMTPEARGYQVDDVNRGVLNPNKGTVRSQTYEFSATEGGTIVYSATAALNFI